GAWPGELMTLLLHSKDAAWQEKALLSSIGMLVGTRRQPTEIAAFLNDAGRLKEPAAALDGLARGLETAQVTGLSVPNADAALARFPLKAVWPVARHLAVPALTARALKIADDEQKSYEERAGAISA